MLTAILLITIIGLLIGLIFKHQEVKERQMLLEILQEERMKRQDERASEARRYLAVAITNQQSNTIH